MEIDLPAHLLARPEDAPSAVPVEDPFLAEDVYAVDGDAALLAVLLQGGDLLVDDVLSGCLHSAASEVSGFEAIIEMKSQ